MDFILPRVQESVSLHATYMYIKSRCCSGFVLPFRILSLPYQNNVLIGLLKNRKLRLLLEFYLYHIRTLYWLDCRRIEYSPFGTFIPIFRKMRVFYRNRCIVKYPGVQLKLNDWYWYISIEWLSRWWIFVVWNLISYTEYMLTIFRSLIIRYPDYNSSKWNPIAIYQIDDSVT